ncbi:hypothetical protein B0H21DRAFT_736745 [Amylocystis lapponica]|nr:hypothetical protein B0H21DRAFT_736745 [Amylocystis lapponica]
MTPSSSLTAAGSPDSQSAPLSDRPERSRNAKAQARHRAKRKAYIEQLEQTVTKLQTVLALSPDQVAALPPPLVKIRELEQENELLHRELDELRRQLEQRNSQLRPDLGRRTPGDDRRSDRDAKRRRLTDATSVYMGSNVSHSPPPPLLIPSPTNYQQNNSQPPSAYPRQQSSSLLPSYGFNYQMPSTPSGSSSTSSPSFSPSDYAPSSASHPQHRHHLTSTHSMLPPFSHTANQYELVKLEDDNYHQNHPVSHGNGYSTTLPPFGSSQPAVNHWQAYSAERA